MQKLKRVLHVLLAVLLAAVLIVLLLLCVPPPARAVSVHAQSVFLVAYPLNVEMEDGSVRTVEFLSLQSCRAQLSAWGDRIRDYGGLAVGCGPVMR